MQLIHIPPGPGGSGTGFWLPVRSGKVILCLTGRDFHPVAIELAAITESELVNGYTTLPPDEHLLCVVIDDPGSLLCGLYSQKRIPVINIRRGRYTGHLASFMTSATYVSGVTLSELARADMRTVPDPVSPPLPVSPPVVRHQPPTPRGIKRLAIGEVRLALWAGEMLPLLRDAAREAIQLALRDILPFMALIALLMALAENPTLGSAIELLLTPLVGSVWGLLLLSVICSFPFLSPLLGPGGGLHAGGWGGYRDADRDRYPARPVRHQCAGRVRLHPGGARHAGGHPGHPRGRGTGFFTLPPADGTAGRRHRLALCHRTVYLTVW
ncbi:PTS glucitol/sorbitol transporter subunit IIB [Yokenella regensburgei]|uniref:PTS glucitol/sorbitol transporter subunit IIB n=1 Tax=Yokenella regensburgei TaxID=158877 RepID=UPI003CD0B129